MGLRKLPDVSTISRALSRMETDGVENVRQLSRAMVIEGLQRERLPRLTLDFDGSVQSTQGHAEGTAVGFNKAKKGARSYYPLFCTVAQTGQFFDVHHRPGNVHDSNGADQFMLSCLSEARVSEINRLIWDDVDLKNQSVTLYTRKKKGGHLTSRRIPMTQQLFEILICRYENRDPSKPWVFWHRYWSRKQGRFAEGPYGDRKKVMKRLCKKAGVRYFRFHPIRHSGASIMDGNGVPLGAIQRILGHENRRTTEIYLHSIGDSERDAIRVFEQARQKSPHNPHTGDQPK